MPQQQRQPEHELVNGIDVKQLAATMDAVRGNPDLAIFRFRAHNEWIDGTHCRTTIKDFYGAHKEDASRAKPFVLEADEPVVLLGKDNGPNATEALLHALASCLNTTFMYRASAHGIVIDKLELDMEGELDLRGILGLSDQVRSGFKNINVTFRVKSDASREQLEELCRIALSHSPVADTVAHPTPISAQLETR